MLPKWDNSYSVHNAKIDEQHKKLFKLAAKVEVVSDRSVSKNEVKELLAEFFNYMKDHFNDEEKYMQLIGYPNLEEHRKIHKEIIQTMINLIKDIKSTNDLKEKLYIVAKKWLLEHILYEDMKVEKWRKVLLCLQMMVAILALKQQKMKIMSIHNFIFIPVIVLVKFTMFLIAFIKK